MCRLKAISCSWPGPVWHVRVNVWGFRLDTNNSRGTSKKCRHSSGSGEAGSFRCQSGADRIDHMFAHRPAQGKIQYSFQHGFFAQPACFTSAPKAAVDKTWNNLRLVSPSWVVLWAGRDLCPCSSPVATSNNGSFWAARKDGIMSTLPINHNQSFVIFANRLIS